MTDETKEFCEDGEPFRVVAAAPVLAGYVVRDRVGYDVAHVAEKDVAEAIADALNEGAK